MGGSNLECREERNAREKRGRREKRSEVMTSDAEMETSGARAAAQSLRR